MAEETKERDPHYASVLGTRKRAILALEPIVEAAREEKKDFKFAEAVHQIVRTPAFEKLLEELLNALGKGFVVVQVH